MRNNDGRMRMMSTIFLSRRLPEAERRLRATGLSVIPGLLAASVCIVSHGQDAPAPPAPPAALDVLESPADEPISPSGADTAGQGGHAGAAATDSDIDLFMLDPVTFVPDVDEVPRLSGPASTVSAEEMEAFSYQSMEDVVTRLPGIYVRTEDGFGLRPNIGLRGVDPDRSKKVTLMEDGLLFGPAPYSAPAAYFVPMVGRMQGVEVYKGPATVRFGPQTIGGAINFLPRPIPERLNGGFDLSLGSFMTGTESGWVGTSNEWGGILFEAINTHSDGFRDIDGGAPTGFSRSEFNLRAALHFESDDARFRHDVELGASYSREISRETYLGVSDEDFRDDAYRRYAGSANGRMQWWRTGAHARYRLSVGDDVTFTAALYRNDYDRSWDKFNRFRSGLDAFTVLSDPGPSAYAVEAAVLRGEEDSSGTTDLLIGTNRRRYVSQGLATRVEHRIGDEDADIANVFEAGVRVHQDSIERDHTEEPFAMRSGALEATGEGETYTSDNTGSSLAIAVHAHDRFRISNLEIAGGLRLEHIVSRFEDRMPSRDGAGETAVNTDSQTAVLPALGVSWELREDLHVVAGVHRGFSPVAPAADTTAEPEYAANYELGLRYERESSGSLVELVGFFTDYNNIVDSCGFSSCGLNEARQFNGGSANIGGLELQGMHVFLANRGYDIPVRLAATWSHARFRSEFDSQNPRWGEVERGFEVPYVPRFTASAEVGVDHDRWGMNVRVAYNDSVLEEAGERDDDVLTTDSWWLLDATASVRVVHNLDLYVRGENLLNQQAIVSRRPYGARSNKPLMVFGGVRWQLHAR